MANDGATPIPVWGIEVGGGCLRAVRAVRRDGGGYEILAFEEVSDATPGPDALISFIRRKGLKNHPLVIAISSPTARLLCSRLPMESVGMDDEDTRSELLEFIHQEPEDVEFRHLDLGGYRYLLSAENRIRVEGYIAALEGAGIPAYALTTSLETMLRVLRDHGYFPGDGLIIRVDRNWSDVILLDGEVIEHQGLPVGSTHLVTEEARRSLAADLSKLVEYHHHRKHLGREEAGEAPAARFLLLGLPPETAAAITPHLPGEVVALDIQDSPLHQEVRSGRGDQMVVGPGGDLLVDRAGEILLQVPTEGLVLEQRDRQGQAPARGDLAALVAASGQEGEQEGDRDDPHSGLLRIVSSICRASSAASVSGYIRVAVSR